MVLKKHHSKISYGLLVAVFVVFFAPLAISFIKNGIDVIAVSVVFFLILIYGCIVYMFFTTVYFIDGTMLRIKVGPFSYKPVPIATIKKVVKTNNIISSPAASFDRIEVAYGKFDEIILSPKDKVGFIRDLLVVNPDIKTDLV